MNEQLRNLFLENWNLFAEAMEKGSTAPLLLRASDAYREAEPRLMFVGQETQGWDYPSGAEDSVGALMDQYEGLRFGKDRRHTPFWKTVHEIREHINLESSDRSILWSNLGKVSLNNDLPSREILDPLLQAEILPKEIKITGLDAVVFFAGPTFKHDSLLRTTFEGAELNQLETNLHKVPHPVLPEQSFRTYHPNYLQQDQQWNLVEAISQRIRINS